MSAAAGSRWKKLFFALLAVNIAALLFIVWLALDSGAPREESGWQHGAGPAVSGLQITASRDELNRMINGYLQARSAGSSGFAVLLGDDVKLTGAVHAFGRSFQLELRFHPVVTEDGDLVLEADSMRIGALPVPVRRALELIDHHIAVPEWVDIAPREKRVHVSFSRMDIRGGLKLKAVEFNPAEDRFRFMLYLPEES